VQLTAAHEMGHALGVPHSGSERDVMYPSNTATSLSAQDYRSMEALYDFEDGTEIVRQGA
jgi:predicted Zn-dependent protease